MFFIPGFLGVGTLVLVWILMASGIPFDKFGWMLLLGLSWFAGYMDSHFVHRKKSNADKTMPPGEDNVTSDKDLFRS